MWSDIVDSSLIVWSLLRWQLNLDVHFQSWFYPHYQLGVYTVHFGHIEDLSSSCEVEAWVDLWQVWRWLCAMVWTDIELLREFESLELVFHSMSLYNLYWSYFDALICISSRWAQSLLIPFWSVLSPDWLILLWVRANLPFDQFQVLN